MPLGEHRELLSTSDTETKPSKEEEEEGLCCVLPRLAKDLIKKLFWSQQPQKPA